MNLNAKYLNLELKSPIIAASSGLTNDVDNLVQLEKFGIGAVVLKSLFEEQISNQVAEILGNQNAMYQHAEAMDYVSYFEQRHLVDQYLQLIKDAKKVLDVPVIASINCASSGDWVTFTKDMQDAGADAVELNIFIMPSGPTETEESIFEKYKAIVQSVKQSVTIPVAVKMGSNFSNILRATQQLSHFGADSLVLFNRFYNPDIDVEKMEITAGTSYTEAHDFSNTLRWISLVKPNVDCDLCATTGIHNGETIVKMLLAGASSVQIASALYKYGLSFIEVLNFRINCWMKDHNYKSVDEFIGKLSATDKVNSLLFERAQFMKYFSLPKK